MRSPLVALLCMSALVSAQTPHAVLKSAMQSAIPPAAAGQSAAPAAASELTVPAGTAIPLTLINPIKQKSTKPGDAVRATVAFPVMAGGQVAVPAGSYVEGEVKHVTARASDTHMPEVQIHFTRLVFANGYSVNLDANSAQAENITPTLGAPVAELASLAPLQLGMGKGSFAMGQSSPTLPPLQNPGPPQGLVIGAMLGGSAALMVTLFAIMHHQQSKLDYVLFDAGWQFQMVLESPLVVDAGQAVRAQTAPSAN